ncbi:MAG: NUDIX domain-containing protein [Pseudomonadota bacterium]
MPKPISEQTFLKNYRIHDYDIPLVSVDMTIFTVWDGQLQALLVKRHEHPELGKWALPGGFVDLERDKTLADTARRKLAEKTGVDTPYLEQVESVGNADRDPRGWSVTIAYFALLAHQNIQPQGSDGAEEVCWVPVPTIKARYALAFDHQRILDSCHLRLRSKVQYTSLPVNLMPTEFTLSELQSTFEIILGSPVEKKSFRRRITDAQILEESGGMRTGSNRPAKLYRVKPDCERHFFVRNLEGPR